ncbi:MAG: MFS transporter, partial [Albimonas sp.]|uniref:MFS transporter n=1 Tax=Albimonas sp. TaxID=1872425 RepID=UPI0040568F58
AAFVAVFGCNMGSRGPVVTALVARLYPQNVGAVFGMITIGLGIGSAVGGFASGLLHDLTGGYGASFVLAIVAAGLGLAPFWLVRSIATGRRDEDGG